MISDFFLYWSAIYIVCSIFRKLFMTFDYLDLHLRISSCDSIHAFVLLIRSPSLKYKYINLNSTDTKSLITQSNGTTVLVSYLDSTLNISFEDTYQIHLVHIHDSIQLKPVIMVLFGLMQLSMLWMKHH